jgi:ABC-2 type transport system ATP-binding protein
MRLQQVCKNFNKNKILDNISFEVRQGEFFALVGINGAGKTTLINCLLDFREITAGHIWLFGVPNTQAIARKHLAFLPEQFVPPYHLTGQDFLSFMAKLYGYPHDLEEVLKTCDTLDLSPVALKKSVRLYSKGMAQKLGLASCFLSQKSLLILDEPMNGLDPKARAHVKKYLLDLKTRNTSLFFTTHILSDVESLCDRMAILHEGRFKFVGTPAECCAQFSTHDLEEAFLRCIMPQDEKHL